MAGVLGKRCQETEFACSNYASYQADSCSEFRATDSLKRSRKSFTSAVEDHQQAVFMQQQQHHQQQQQQHQLVQQQQQCSNAPAAFAGTQVSLVPNLQGAPQQAPPPGEHMYYGQTSLPLDGWFHPCRCCRSWTANTQETVDGGSIPICKRCVAKVVASAVAARERNPAPAPIREASGSGSDGLQNTDASRSSSLFGPTPSTPQSFSSM